MSRRKIQVSKRKDETTSSYSPNQTAACVSQVLVASSAPMLAEEAVFHRSTSMH